MAKVWSAFAMIRHTVFLIVLLLIIVWYVMYSYSQREKFEDRTDYEHRLYIIKLFNAVLSRNPTPEEIQKYAGLASETAIMQAVMTDYKLVPSAPEKPVPSPPPAVKVKDDDELLEFSKSETKTKTKTKTKTAVEKETETPQRTCKKKKAKKKKKCNKKPASSSSESEQDDLKDKKWYAVEYNDPVTKLSHGNTKDEVCTDRQELLLRLKKISSEVNQFYHFVSVM